MTRTLVSYEVIRADLGSGDHAMSCKATWSDGRTTWYGGPSTGAAIHGLYFLLYTYAPGRTTEEKRARAWEQMEGKRAGTVYADEED